MVEPTPEQIKEALLRGSVFLVVITNGQGIVSHFNAAAEKELGYSAHEIVGKQSPMIWHDPLEVSQYAAELSAEVGRPVKPDFDVFIVKAQLLISGEKEWTFIRKDGSRFPGLLSLEAITDKQNNIVGYIGIIKDITVRKMQQRVLVARELVFDAVVRNIVEGLATINDEGIVQSYNPACEKLFGYKAAEVIGQNISMLMQGQDRSQHNDYIDHYLKTGEAKIIGLGREVVGRRKDGSVFPLDLSITRFESEGNVMFSGLMRDVSERKKVAVEREQLIDSLAESNAELERFAYVASHDMQEPLRTMCSFSDLILAEYKDALDDDGKLYLKLIYDAAAHMQKMVVDLLDYARVNKETGPFVPFDTSVEFKQVLEDLASSIGATHARITCDALPQIRGNPVQFSRLLQNLIGNALKYHRPYVEPVIHLRADDKDGAWQFSLSDNGIGVPAKDLKKIFEPFRRLHGRQEYAGTGLGLSACKKIVENHAGEIWCESVVGEGTTFFFTWPK